MLCNDGIFTKSLLNGILIRSPHDALCCKTTPHGARSAQSTGIGTALTRHYAHYDPNAGRLRADFVETCLQSRKPVVRMNVASFQPYRVQHARRHNALSLPA